MTTYNNIPILNIYYMLCYAWETYPDKQTVDVSSTSNHDMYELLSHVLANSLAALIKKGLYKEYISEKETLGVIRGKIDFSASIRSNSIHKARLVCEYDEFSENIIHNQIIKSTLRNLLSIKTINPKIKAQLKNTYHYFGSVSTIKLSSGIFKQARLHQNNQQYRLILNICHFLYENMLIDEKSGVYKFKIFEIEDREMAYLFERFVRNFYKRHLVDAKVYREDIMWEANGEQLHYLPKMQTDISIKLPHKKIIMDTKFYREALSKNYDAEKIKSANLYQLYAYLNHAPDRHHYQMEGILLYPEVKQNLDLVYEMQGSVVKVMTVNLNEEWQEVSKRLVVIVK